MSTPFGFGMSPGDDDPNKGPGPDNPFSALFSGDPNALGAMFTQLGQMLSYSGGPVNWDLAKDTARKTVAAAGPDPSINAAERHEVDEAIRLAELWLDPLTVMPAGANASLAWSRAEWIENTLAVWKQLVEPVATRVVEAMGGAMPAQLPEEMRDAAAPLLGMMKQMGGAMFGAQVGQALGSLAGEVLGATDIGLPLGPAARAVLVPANVAAFGEGLGVPADQVRLYLALREAAHQRLFAHVPWLRTHVLSAVEAYAGGISVQMDKLEEIVSGLDPMNPQAIGEAFNEGMFTPENTPAQQAALARLETILALIEGWVDEVAGSAAAEHLAAAPQLREAIRRRRASGGPAEQTFGTLIGLELRPRRLREAADLWQRLSEARGIDGRDAIWAHPDLLPTAEDLDDPAAFVSGKELDISSLLDGSLGEAPPEGEMPGSDAEGDSPDSPGTDEK
ncbi:zinc-dependent metalloprotease [Sporichthya sp.]|uniref:zinc-dependent metalloprotease n=1 Tax=Sporichthya sp. TaxID=65475 RepID=UPI0017A6D9BE|nr:zinc-dependent metalloprotease [Sporichthya sp.]MBA3741400.1 zinc-dependent metalloprotease [Sporichthya sp.]